MANDVAALRVRVKLLEARERALERVVKQQAARLAKLEHRVYPMTDPEEARRMTERWSKQQRRVEAAG